LYKNSTYGHPAQHAGLRSTLFRHAHCDNEPRSTGRVPGCFAAFAFSYLGSRERIGNRARVNEIKVGVEPQTTPISP